VSEADKSISGAKSDAVAGPPRPLTAHVRRRSWGEPCVRLWWIVAVVLAVVGAWYTVKPVRESARLGYLINNGLVVKAHVDELDGTSRDNYVIQPAIEAWTEAKLTFQMPDGTSHTVQGRISPEGDAIHPRMDITLRVDPHNLANWTNRTRQPSHWQDWLVAILLMPVAVVAVAIAWWRRRGILAAWQSAPAVLATVVGSRQSPTAPLSRLLQVRLVQGTDRRVFAVTVPSRGRVPAIGENLQVILPGGQPQGAFVASLYQSPPA
jgi:hypothetical protein